MSNVEKHDVSRRQFIKGAAVSAAAVASSGILASCAPRTATQAAVEPTAAAGATAGATTSAAPAGQYSFEVPPAPIADGDIASTVEADVIVVGGGISGLVTANSAAENGAKVILISASKAAVYRGGSFHSRKSKALTAAGVEPYDVDRFFREQMAMAGYWVDQNKWWKFDNNSEEAINWLIEKMEAAGFKTALEHDNQEPNNGPMGAPSGSHSWINDQMKMVGMGASFVAQVLTDTATKAGVQLIWKTVAKQLVREDNNKGRVSAVIAQGEDGKYTKYVGKKAIVLATGDFSANKEMMQKYCPMALPLLSDKGDQGYDNTFKFGGLFKGEGQQMGLWIGAGWQKTFPNAPMIQGKWIASDQPYGSHRGLLMDKNGYRFGNEDINGPYGGIQQIRQPGMKAFAIWDAKFAEKIGPWYNFGQEEGSDPQPVDAIVASWEDSVKNGTYKKADTLDELIKALGLPAEATKATIEHYNEMCKKGEDADFHKRKELLIPIETGPFYGADTALPDFLTVMGGLRTSINMQVCDADDNPIPGLFNVGTMVGDYYANMYNFLVAGNNYGACCLTFGYLTGRAIAKGEIA
jgi:succinate dehydrogenase/fumarate reductase flavoprotein subunit